MEGGGDDCEVVEERGEFDPVPGFLGPYTFAEPLSFGRIVFLPRL